MNKDSAINIHEMDMSQIQLDNQKRFLKSCKNLQVQTTPASARQGAREIWDGHGQVLRHKPDIQGLTETGCSSLPAQPVPARYHLTDGRAQGSPSTLFIHIYGTGDTSGSTALVSFDREHRL